MWWSFHSSALFISPYSLPYTEANPLTYKRETFETIDDVWKVVNDISEENKKSTRSLGQDLFHLVPLFTDPSYIVEDWHYHIINEFNILKNLNVSLGVLDNIDAKRLEYLTIGNNEYNAIQKFNAKEK